MSTYVRYFFNETQRRQKSQQIHNILQLSQVLIYEAAILDFKVRSDEVHQT